MYELIRNIVLPQRLMGDLGGRFLFWTDQGAEIDLITEGDMGFGDVITHAGDGGIDTEEGVSNREVGNWESIHLEGGFDIDQAGNEDLFHMLKFFLLVGMMRL